MKIMIAEILSEELPGRFQAQAEIFDGVMFPVLTVSLALIIYKGVKSHRAYMREQQEIENSQQFEIELKEKE